MITYGSTTLTSYNSIVKTEVYYYKSTSATSLSGGSWATTKPTWENGKYIWQKIRTVYEDGTHSESDPVNITGQQGATGTAAYSYKLNSSDSIIGKTKDGEYTIKKITFSATYKQGTGAVSAYSGRFKIESTTNGSTWKTEYTSSGNEASKEFTIPDDIIAIKCSLYQSDGTTVLLDIVTVPVVKDGIDAIGLRDSIPYYLASDKDTGITRLTQGWTRYRPQLTAEKKYLWVYYVSRYSEGTTEPELIEIKDDLVHFVNNGNESPVESCVVDIEPVQEGSGDPSPDNVRPITGWTGCKVQRTGKNLLSVNTIEDVAWAYDLITTWYAEYNISKIINSLDVGTYTISYTETVTSVDTQKYTSTTAKAGMGNMTIIASNGDRFSNDKVEINLEQALNHYSITNDLIINVTANNKGKFTHCYIYGLGRDIPTEGALNGALGLGEFSNLQLELGSTATPYEPYQGDTYDITFPSEAGTVYGGTLDVTSGVLTVTDAQIASYAGETLPGEWISDRDVYVAGTTPTTGAQVVYKLATPITYTLTPQEITMLCKENNIFADTGQTAISYYDNQTSTDPYVDYSLTSAFDASTDALDKAKEVAQDLTDLGADLQAQIDGKIETWCQKTDPSTAWTTTELKNQHNGDLWYYTGESTSSYKNNTTYKYTVSTNKWTAYSASTDLFDKIDAKASIYYGKPSAVTQNLEVGDYLVDSTDGCSYRWDGSKWVKLTDYKTAIDEIEVGGRNLVWRSNWENMGNKWSYLGSPTIREIVTINGKKWLHLKTSGSRFQGYSQNSNQRNGYGEIKEGDNITVSFTAYAAENNITAYIGMHWRHPTSGIVSQDWINFTLSTSPTRYSKVLTVMGTGVTGFNIMVGDNSTDIKEIWITDIKAEKGNKPTNWSPAPEDVDASISTAQSTADTAMDRATAIYGTCSTDSIVDAKVVVCPDFVLFDGARIQVTFTNTNTASAPTLNVNSTGAKAIYINKTVTSSSNLLLWTAGSKMEFVYDGTGWIAQNIPYALYGICSTGASTAAKAVTCNEAVICKGTTISVNMTNTNTAANATMNVGSTLAKDIYANGVKLTTNSRFNWRANTVQKFVFDGQVWRMDDDSVKALATAYITEIDEDGIMVHPEDDSNSGWAISDAIQLFKNGISYIKLWIENNIPKIRIGKEDQGHIILDNDSVDIRNDDKVLASFGATSVIGDENDWHQTIAANQITFAKGNDIITYISPDKLYTINAEVADAFYISNYSIRNASDGKLVIGLRR